jgi:hypothetical protein
MAGPKKQRLVAEKRGFRVKPIKHPRYKFVVYRIESGRRVEQAYFQSERGANSHAYTENIRLKNEGTQAQTLGPELRGQAIEATRRLEPYGKTLRDAVDFYEAHLKSEASLRQIKLGAFIKEFLHAKEEGKIGKKRRKAKPGTLVRFAIASIFCVNICLSTALKKLGHSTPRLLVEHYRIVTPANAQAWWTIVPACSDSNL